MSDIVRERSLSTTSQDDTPDDIDLDKLSKDELKQIIGKQKSRNKLLLEEIRKAHAQSANISKQVEAEEECIANKLMKRLSEVQREKEHLMKKVQYEEENLSNNLKTKLKDVLREKVDLENQLEQEQEYIVNKLSKQLKEAISKKDALQKKLETEKKAKDDLVQKIYQEEVVLKETLQKKLTQMQKEKVDIENQLEQEEEFMVNKLQQVLERIINEKSDLENQLAIEVREKQDLVLALEREKQNLTIELQKKIREIKKDKSRIRRYMQIDKDVVLSSSSSTPRTAEGVKKISYTQGPEYDAHTSESEYRNTRKLITEIRSTRNLELSSSRTLETTPSKTIEIIPCKSKNEGETSLLTTPRTEKGEEKKGDEKKEDDKDEQPNINSVIDQMEGRLTLLQRDRDYYEGQNKKMMHKIVALTTQLDKANMEAPRYKKLLEEIKANNLKLSQSKSIAQKMGLDPKKITTKNYQVDSSMDVEATDSSSFISGDSSFSYDKRSERSFSTDMRTSLDSSQEFVNSQTSPAKFNPLLTKPNINKVNPGYSSSTSSALTAKATSPLPQQK